MEKFLSTQGRLRRKEFLTRALLLGIPMVAYFIRKTVYGQEMLCFQSTCPRDFLSELLVLLSVGIFIIQAIKRLHDINKSGWYILFLFVPILNIILKIFLFFKDGTIGENNFGADPKGRKK